LVRERSALATRIVSRRICLWVCHCVVLSVCPHFKNVSSPAVLVGIKQYFNTMFYCVECISAYHK